MKVKQKQLFFICPTDHMEPIIDKLYECKNYYYTSLGNSVVFNNYIINQIERLILENNIKEVSFVLANTNPIIEDALKNQNFSDIRALKNCYHEIIRQKKYSDVFWYKYNRDFVILSHYLNKKIKELQLKLNTPIADQINISGKIYNKQAHVFDDVNIDLMQEYFSLN